MTLSQTLRTARDDGKRPRRRGSLSDACLLRLKIAVIEFFINFDNIRGSRPIVFGPLRILAEVLGAL
jgi:hypothetical protein